MAISLSSKAAQARALYINKNSENVSALVDTVKRMKPSSSKGIYLRNFSLSSTMGPGIKVDPQTA